MIFFALCFSLRMYPKSRSRFRRWHVGREKALAVWHARPGYHFAKDYDRGVAIIRMSLTREVATGSSLSNLRVEYLCCTHRAVR